MKRTKLPEIAGVASDQWGMISTAQATAVGADARTLARLAANGQVERLTHGVYRLVGSPPGPHDELRAAWIALDPHRTAAERIAAGPIDVVSHRSAAALQELGDLDADVLEFTASVRRQTRREDVRIHRGKIGEHDWTLADGLPVTTPLRTIEDLATARIDRGHLAGVVRDALLRGGVSLGQVATALAPHARAYGVTAGDGGKLVDLLVQEAGAPQSALDMATRAGPETQQLLVNQLIHSGAFSDSVRDHVNSLAATGFFEAVAQMQRTAAPDLLSHPVVQVTIGKTIADLIASLDSTADTRAAIQRWLDGLPAGVKAAVQQQIEAAPSPADSAHPDRGHER
ncbi:type IV toxin-antitoxin system AbiEi family antitoxin domain-containing protein [Planosporangium sp. 12N6]|uniref:type IV toxin-antitoxin system AbiEi family antitoxin domain-containing protein n=1 Tax=Planosporangium spinosum TaxID=3402278 RepID=UPI003CEFA16C